MIDRPDRLVKEAICQSCNSTRQVDSKRQMCASCWSRQFEELQRAQERLDLRVLNAGGLAEGDQQELLALVEEMRGALPR